MGLHRAWPEAEIVGVDIEHQPRYPFKFIRGDALDFDLSGFDFIWASPVCRGFSSLRFLPTAKEWPDQVTPTCERLSSQATPYCVENVIGAPMGRSGWVTMLCGTMFGLVTPDGRAEIRRHRIFQTNFPIVLRPSCWHHAGIVLTVTGHGSVNNRRVETLAVCGGGSRVGRRATMSVTGSTPQRQIVRNVRRETFPVSAARTAMEIDWMSRDELSQAVPPAYSEFIARQLEAFL
jgi:DNA (cytosine-5)-methyltransferase 1